MKLTINSYELKQVLNIVAGFTDNENSTTPILELVNVVNEEGKVYFYATDKYRAVKYHISKCKFEDLTSFKLDPKFILKLLSLYALPYSYVDVTFHAEIGENVYFIDIGNAKNIPLPRVIEQNYPSINHFFELESGEEDQALSFDVNNLLNTLRQFRIAGCKTVKLISSSYIVKEKKTKIIRVISEQNKNLDTVIIPARF